MQALSIVLAVLAFVGALFVLPLVGVCVGAFAGWVVGLLFPGTVGLVGSAIAGGAVLPSWQVGAILGFVGGFFKARVTTSK